MCSDETLGRFPHRAKIHSSIAHGMTNSVEFRQGPALAYSVTIPFSSSGEKGVKLRTDPFDSSRADGFRQGSAQGMQQRLGRVDPMGVKVKDLLPSMNPCIRSSGADRSYGPAKDGFQRLFDLVLHGLAVRLLLPTVEIGSIVSAQAAPALRKGVFGHWERKSLRKSDAAVASTRPALFFPFKAFGLMVSRAAMLLSRSSTRCTGKPKRAANCSMNRSTSRARTPTLPSICTG